MNMQSARAFAAKHKKWLVVASAILVVVMALSLSQRQNRPGVPGSVKTYQREGFGKLAGSVADPAAIVGNGHEKPVSYGGSIVINACNLMPLDHLNREKIRLYPNPVNSTYERYYIGSDGGEMQKKGIALGNEVNECEYILNDRNTLSINVWQPAYLATEYMKYDLAKYTAVESTQPGVTHQTQTKASGVVSHLLQKGDIYAEFSFISSLNKDKAALEALTNKLMPHIIQNFAAQADKPDGLPTYKYDSPTFTKSVALSCSLINADSFLKVFKVQPSAVVHEKVTSAIGLISGFQDTGSQYFHYTHNECERVTGDSSYRSEQKRVNVVAASYEDPKGTKAAFDFDKPGDKGAPTPRTYGDGSYVVTVPHKADPGTVVIRKGRFLIKLTMSDPAHESSKTDPKYFVEQLDPAIDDILSHLPR